MRVVKFIVINLASLAFCMTVAILIYAGIKSVGFDPGAIVLGVLGGHYSYKLSRHLEDKW